MFDTERMAETEPSGTHRARSDTRRARLRLVGDRVRPHSLARERTMPVLPVLAGLFPDGGLRRGSVVTVAGPGATLLALAVAAGPSSVGSWTAIVGDPGLGLMAAAESGVALERILVVDPGDADSWAGAMAALIGAVDVVVVGPGHRSPGATRRISSRLRERGSVVVAIGGSWAPGADIELTLDRAEWVGLGDGHGVLRSRLVTVGARGRGASARPRRIDLWLPGSDGAPGPVHDAGHTGADEVDAVRDRWSATERLVDAG
jgi:hypothetical protein